MQHLQGRSGKVGRDAQARAWGGRAASRGRRHVRGILRAAGAAFAKSPPGRTNPRRRPTHLGSTGGLKCPVSPTCPWAPGNRGQGLEVTGKRSPGRPDQACGARRALAILESRGPRGHHPSEAGLSRSSVPPETRVPRAGKERRDLNPQVHPLTPTRVGT